MSKVEKTVTHRPERTVTLSLDLGNSGFFLSKVLFNRILKNSTRALKKLAQLFQVLDNVHPCHPLQKTTGNSSSTC